MKLLLTAAGISNQSIRNALVDATIPMPSYMIDDNTAIKVTDGNIEVISEGQWKLFTPDKTTKR